MKDIHLLVGIHGMWGLPSDLRTMAETLQKTHQEKSPEPGVDFEFLLASTFSKEYTYDGIDWCAERVVKEVMDRKTDLEEDDLRRVTRLSVCSFSLGGLIARYAIGILYDRGFFKTVTPVNFATFASPHLGLMEYDMLMSKATVFIVTWMLSRVGPQFFGRDKWTPNGEPLLIAMADPRRVFYKALAAFRNISIYANGIQDPNVPFLTACISTYDPFFDYPQSGLQIKYAPRYHPLLASYKMPKTSPLPQIPFYRRLTVRLPRWMNTGIHTILICGALPLLIPGLLGVYLVRYAGPNNASKRRIKDLEDAIPVDTRLVRLWQELSTDVAEANAHSRWQTIDEPQNLDTQGAVRASRPDEFSFDAVELSPLGAGADSGSKPPLQRGAPTVTALQERMAASLNTIPHMKKHIAFIPQYPNVHEVIVCKDPVGLPSHEAGRGVVRHWADCFEF